MRCRVAALALAAELSRADCVAQQPSYPELTVLPRCKGGSTMRAHLSVHAASGLPGLLRCRRLGPSADLEELNPQLEVRQGVHLPGGQLQLRDGTQALVEHNVLVL
jgi:hypothetical protein